MVFVQEFKMWHTQYINEYKSIGTQWIALHVNGDNVTYSDCFRVEYIPEEIKTFMGNKNITTSI